MEPENRSREYFYHWSGRFRLSELDRDVITYSVPLIWEDGTLLGVLGIDVSCDYVAGQLRYQELGDGTAGAYFLGISRDGGTTYTTAVSYTHLDVYKRQAYSRTSALANKRSLEMPCA